MEEKSYRDSDLEKWLRKNNLSTKDFCQIIGCSRFVAWKIKNGLVICEDFSQRVRELTDQNVNPLFNPSKSY